MKQKRQDYKDNFLRDYIGITGIIDLTLQDVYGAMTLLVRTQDMKQVSKSLWSYRQFEHLYQRMMDTSDPYNDILEKFKNAVYQTRYDRKRREKQTPDVHARSEEEYKSPEEDMDTVSKELLRKDEVMFDSRQTLFREFMRLNESLFEF